jgi:hypothetical protein
MRSTMRNIIREPVLSQKLLDASPESGRGGRQNRGVTKASDAGQKEKARC